MVTRMGHIALRVPDLDAAVDFQRDVINMVEVERTAGVSYMTCNERHHELILIQDPVRRGYDHIGLEVADAKSLERAKSAVAKAGGRVIGDVYDGEPGIDRALRVQGPGGHVFKLFCGMQASAHLEPGDRPIKFEHASVKVRDMRRMERFLQHGLGFGFSDRMGRVASWWHCDEDHHGMALALAPRPELAHYCYAYNDLNEEGRVADRLRALRNQAAVWGPVRHGPGHNQSMYLHDNDGALIELSSDLAVMTQDHAYAPRTWPVSATTLSQWGGGKPPLRFLLAGFPIVTPDDEQPAYATAPNRTPAIAA
jgi:catechol 2,3-dioxygenase-like lactoylglutathione lyase family enzyme